MSHAVFAASPGSMYQPGSSHRHRERAVMDSCVLEYAFLQAWGPKTSLDGLVYSKNKRNSKSLLVLEGISPSGQGLFKAIAHASRDTLANR